MSSVIASLASRLSPSSSALASLASRLAPSSSALASLASRLAPSSSALASLASCLAPSSSALASLASRLSPSSSALASLASRLAPCVFGLLAALSLSAATSEITVDLKLDSADYVLGERLRAVVDVMNVSPEHIDVGRPRSPDRFLIEVFRASDRGQIEPASRKPFVAPFTLHPNEGQKLETFLSDRFGLATPNHYLVRPVLVHKGLRYEGRMRAFDVVPGMKVTSALQMFANHKGLQREFELVCWRRAGYDHLFLTAKDAGTGDRRWHTIDLGQLMKVTKPTISIMPGGEVIVIHRVDPDNFIRSEFWSVPDAIEFHRRELVQDPETAGSNRVRELYKDSGGIKPKVNPWWKFW